MARTAFLLIAVAGVCLMSQTELFFEIRSANRWRAQCLRLSHVNDELREADHRLKQAADDLEKADLELKQENENLVKVEIRLIQAHDKLTAEFRELRRVCFRLSAPASEIEPQARNNGRPAQIKRTKLLRTNFE